MEQSARFKPVHAVALLLPGAAAAAWLLRQFPPEQSRFYPLCPIHAYTGLLCPGCGATRAIAALLHGNLRGAFELNALVLCLLPFAAAYLLHAMRRPDGAWPEISKPVYASLVVLTAAFTLWRNIAA